MGVPYTESWNGSLWTLAWEFLCYVGLLLLGLLGMTRRKWLLWAALGGAVALYVASSAGLLQSEALQRVGRFALFFICGSLVAQHARQIRTSGWLALLSVVVALCSVLLPFPYLIAAPAFAFGLTSLGGVVHPKWASLPNDISYGVYIYAFPVQQTLAATPLVGLGVWPFSAAAGLLTIPLALASWFLVEKPAMRLRKRLERPIVPSWRAGAR